MLRNYRKIAEWNYKIEWLKTQIRIRNLSSKIKIKRTSNYFTIN